MLYKAAIYNQKRLFWVNFIKVIILSIFNIFKYQIKVYLMKIWLIYIYLEYGYFGGDGAFRSFKSRDQLGSTCILVPVDHVVVRYMSLRRCLLQVHTFSSKD